MNRRAFLRLLPFGLAAGISGHAWALPSTAAAGARFVMVFLRGGCDTLSLLAPYADEFYYDVRPNIAIPPPDEANPLSALPIDDRWGLHPAFRDSLLPLFLKGEAAFVPFGGSAHVTRSHFEAQDRIELAAAPGERSGYGDGFLNRLVRCLRGRDEPGGGVSFTQHLPLAFNGPQLIPNVPAGTSAVRSLGEERQARIAALYAGHRLESVVGEALGSRQQIAEALAAEMIESARGAPPPVGLERSAAGIGRVLRSRPEYSVAFIEVGGWDTHAGQGGSAGMLATHLGSLGRALIALRNGLNESWRSTVVFVMTEFGRTVRENGNRGTDHGHGSTMLLLGGAIRGGVHGEQVALDPTHLNEQRDLPVMSDYRVVLGGIFRRLFGLTEGEILLVFPGVAPSSLHLL